MKTNQKKKEPQKRTPKQSKETLEERVHRHLNDINSKITDEDIRNVRTEMEIRGEGPARPPIATQENKKQNRRSPKQKKGNELQSGKHTTPWDILSED